MTSLKQITANWNNAKLSTGPKSDEGKSVVSGNRLSHGILSNKLLLKGESPEEFGALLDDLQSQLRPVGTLELSLVERIAVTLWRQRRLVRAETATTELNSNTKRIASLVESAMGLSPYGEDRIRVVDLAPPDQEQIAWCKGVLAEYRSLDRLDLAILPKQAPLLHTQLRSDAESEGATIDEYLSDSSFRDYVDELISWCRRDLAELEKKAERYPVVTEMAERAKDKLSVPWDKLDLLNKYQTTLDNQLFKTVKALREAQEWRLKSLDEQVGPTSTEVDPQAAGMGLNRR